MSFHFPTKNSQILLDFWPNPGEPSLKVIEQWFQGRLDTNITADYCWMLKRDMHLRKKI